MDDEQIRVDVFTDATPWPQAAGVVRAQKPGMRVDVEYGPGIRSESKARLIAHEMLTDGG